jgi:hypothetical protein
MPNVLFRQQLISNTQLKWFRAPQQFRFPINTDPIPEEIRHFVHFSRSEDTSVPQMSC